MTTVLFIHGTGVREPTFTQTYTRIDAGLREVRPDLSMERCYWGEIGADLLAQGDSFYFDPYRDRTDRVAAGDEPVDGDRAPAEAVPKEEKELARWARLFDDPLYEVRLREIDDAPTTPFGPLIRDRLLALPDDEQIAAELAASDLTDAFEAAVRSVTASDEFDAAFGDVRATDADNERMLARALVASCLAALADRGVEFSGDRRDHLVDVVLAGLGAAPEHGPEEVTDRLGALALNAAYRLAEPVFRLGRRKRIDDLADIVYYQAHGRAIREVVRKRIRDVPGPVVLLGHSLGGIIAFDILAAGAVDPGQVRMLVTVGSQVPLLYELNALSCGFKFRTDLPNGFPRWLNVYDPRDLLAYGGRVLFPDRCHDLPVNTKTPFPTAHGAYWDTGAFYRGLADALKAAGL